MDGFGQKPLRVWCRKVGLKPWFGAGKFDVFGVEYWFGNGTKAGTV
jgi:hypothetical protein